MYMYLHADGKLGRKDKGGRGVLVALVKVEVDPMTLAPLEEIARRQHLHVVIPHLVVGNLYI